MKYWKDGFYDAPIDGAVEISDERFFDLLDGQSSGLHIKSDEAGHPQLVEYVTPPRDIKLARISDLKALLAETDYQALKVADGAMTAEEYEPTKVQRTAWRAEINSLQQGLVDS